MEQTNDFGRAPSGQALAVPVEPVCAVSPLTGFDPSRIVSLDAPRYSPNLRAWLGKQTRLRCWRSFPAVYLSEDGSRWIGWLDADPDFFIGSKLWRCICDGAKAEVSCWTFPITDLTEETDFWPRYAEIGRCLIDPEHKRGFLNEEKTRWLTDGDTRSCLWCGNHTEHLRRWTEEVKRERWEPASAMSAGTAETQSGSGLQPASAAPKEDARNGNAPNRQGI